MDICRKTPESLQRPLVGLAAARSWCCSVAAVRVLPVYGVVREVHAVVGQVAGSRRRIFMSAEAAQPCGEEQTGLSRGVQNASQPQYFYFGVMRKVSFEKSGMRTNGMLFRLVGLPTRPHGRCRPAAACSW